jgi:hypothetical protein
MNDTLHTHTIRLTLADYKYITGLLAGVPLKNESLQRLRRELARAVVLEPALIPPTVVGINSRVQLKDLDTQEIENYTLVAPHKADANEGRITDRRRVARLPRRRRDRVAHARRRAPAPPAARLPFRVNRPAHAKLKSFVSPTSGRVKSSGPRPAAACAARKSAIGCS